MDAADLAPGEEARGGGSPRKRAEPVHQETVGVGARELERAGEGRVAREGAEDVARRGDALAEPAQVGEERARSGRA